MLRSESYSSMSAANNGINAVKKNGGNRERIKLQESSDGRYYFTLSAANSQIIAVSQMYKYKESAQKGIDWVVESFKDSAANKGDVVEALSVIREKIQLIGSVKTFLAQMESMDVGEGISLYYRGQSDSAFEILPGVYRDKSWIENEDVMLRELIMRCPGDFDSSESTFQALVKMQHYSLPTRLLDITKNPLIALYFACIGENKSSNGEVLVFRIPKKEIKYYDGDQVSILSNIARCPFDFVTPTQSDVDSGKGRSLHKLLHEIRSEKSYFMSKIKVDQLSSVVCVRPKLSNPRIIKQDGAFLLFGIDGDKSKPAKVPKSYIGDNKDRLIIRSSEKDKILKQLEVLGISHGSIFPEIESVAGYIRETYRAVQ